MTKNGDFDYHRKLDGTDHFDQQIMNLLGVIGGSNTAKEALDKEIAQIDADTELSDTGKAKRKAALHPKHLESDDLRRLDVWAKQGRETMTKLFNELTARPVTKPKSSDPAEATAELLRRELSNHRMLLDYRALPAEQQRAKKRDAIEKCSTSETARQVIFGLRDDGLLSDAEWSRAEAQLMQGVDAAKFKKYCELCGAPRFDGTFDEATGLVAQADYALHKLREHAQAVTAAPQSAAYLADSKNLPAPVMTKEAMILNRQTATDVSVYRAAQAECEAQGLRLEIEAFDQQGSAQ